MRTKYLLCILLVSLSAANVWAQGEIFAPMTEAIKSNDAKELVRYFYQSADINIEGDVNNYSKAQAEFVLGDFFKKHPVSDFTIVHTGSSPSGLMFAIGKYQSGSDAYSVLMRVKESDKKQLIHEISFVKE